MRAKKRKKERFTLRPKTERKSRCHGRVLSRPLISASASLLSLSLRCWKRRYRNVPRDATFHVRLVPPAARLCPISCVLLCPRRACVSAEIRNEMKREKERKSIYTCHAWDSSACFVRAREEEGYDFCTAWLPANQWERIVMLWRIWFARAAGILIHGEKPRRSASA